MEPLFQTYWEMLGTWIDEDGVGLNHGLARQADGSLTMYALDLTPQQAYAHMLVQGVTKKPLEIIFALDRFAKPGQGTTLRDLVAGHYKVEGQPSRPFIIEYRHEPRLVLPIEWNNPFWNAALTNELSANIAAVLKR